MNGSPPIVIDVCAFLLASLAPIAAIVGRTVSPGREERISFLPRSPSLSLIVVFFLFFFFPGEQAKSAFSRVKGATVRISNCV